MAELQSATPLELELDIALFYKKLEEYCREAKHDRERSVPDSKMVDDLSRLSDELIEAHNQQDYDSVQRIYEGTYKYFQYGKQYAQTLNKGLSAVEDTVHRPDMKNALKSADINLSGAKYFENVVQPQRARACEIEDEVKRLEKRLKGEVAMNWRRWERVEEIE
ncbi:hypothetical protein LTS10_004327 [Elasticomyces elasticus]|nr:hypothetical protein LTS10_004327 [Elasticomyces elasticus]